MDTILGMEIADTVCPHALQNFTPTAMDAPHSGHRDEVSEVSVSDSE